MIECAGTIKVLTPSIYISVNRSRAQSCEWIKKLADATGSCSKGFGTITSVEYVTSLTSYMYTRPCVIICRTYIIYLIYNILKQHFSSFKPIHHSNQLINLNANIRIKILKLHFLI